MIVGHCLVRKQKDREWSAVTVQAHSASIVNARKQLDCPQPVAGTDTSPTTNFGVWPILPCPRHAIDFLDCFNAKLTEMT